MPVRRARFAAAHARWLAAALPRLRRFHAALGAPRAAQERALARIAPGHGSIREFQDRVSVGAATTLAEPVLAWETTTGTTGRAKRVPYTAGLLDELWSALLPWMADTWLRRPKLLALGMYWSVSPMATDRTGGFAEDVDFFGPLGAVLRRALLTPPGLAAIPDVATSRYVTLRFLVGHADLGFVSVWHPSFLELLADAMDEHAERLVDDVRAGTLRPPAPLPAAVAGRLAAALRPLPRRAALLARALRRDGRLRPEVVWPRLRLLSCWADAAAAPYAARLARRFPRAEVQPKGLLATEGVVSVPWGRGPGAVLAVGSHLLEFVDEQDPGGRPRLADELAPGATYEVLLTTSGGLRRHALGDRVRVVGRTAATPRVELLGRSRAVSDLCGEKLHEPAVHDALRSALAEAAIEPAFALLAPEEGHPPAYGLFLECGPASAAVLAHLGRRLDHELHVNPHYAYCRRLGQLGPVRPFVVERGGVQTYLDRLAGEGQRAGSIKPAVLSATPGWSARFRGAFVEGA